MTILAIENGWIIDNVRMVQCNTPKSLPSSTKVPHYIICGWLKLRITEHVTGFWTRELEPYGINK